jgi:hypothetical protein
MKPSSPAPARPWASGFTDGDLVASAVLFQPPGSSANRLPYFGPSLSLILGWLCSRSGQMLFAVDRLLPTPSVPLFKPMAKRCHRERRMSPKLFAPSRPNFGLHCRGNPRQVPARLPEETASNLSTKRFAFLSGCSCPPWQLGRSCLHWKQSRGGSFRGPTKKRQGHGHGMFEKPKREATPFPLRAVSQSSRQTVSGLCQWSFR